MTSTLRVARVVAESIGAVTAAGIHAVAYIAFAAGAGLLDMPRQRQLYWTSIVVAYLAMIGLARFGLGGSTPRQKLDAWLLALVPTSIVVAWMIAEEWPLHFGITTAHGFGPRGGEANAAFLPWLHMAAWWAVDTRVMRRFRRVI